MPTQDEIFAMIAIRRRLTADMIDTFTPEQGAVRSLCDDWTVQAVAAHLVMAFEVSLPKMMLGMIRYRGDFNSLSRDWAIKRSGRPLGQLAAILRDNAEHRFTPPGLDAHAPLTDILLHSLDMSIPLSVPNPIAAEPADTSLAFLTSPLATRGFLSKGRVAGLRFESTDSGFAHGDGPLVRGPSSALLSALGGRKAVYESLEGDGVETLRTRP